jgi:hypothetical protein
MAEDSLVFVGDGLHALLDHGYEVTFTKDSEGRGYRVSLAGPLGSRSTGIGASPAAALTSVWPVDLDEDDLDDLDDEDEPYCYTCGVPVAIFYGHGDGWHHWRGKGTAGSPVVLYDAGHAPEVAWRAAGA